MRTDSIARRISALTIVVAVLVVGMPSPVGAAGEDVVPFARHGGLTLNGRPLSGFVGATAAVRGPFPLASLLEQERGQIRGVALDGVGQSVTGETVQLRHVGPPTEVVATTATDANGRFSFAALGAGRYIVDLRIAGKVVATSGLFSLAEGGMTFTQLGGISTQPSSSDDGQGKGGLFWMKVGAIVGVGAGLILTARNQEECDRSDALLTCPAATMLLGTFGGILGLGLGAGR